MTDRNDADTGAGNDDAADADASGPSGLREAKERAESKASAAVEKLRRVAMNQMGVDPDSSQAKAIESTYDGEIDPEDLEPVVKHANETLGMSLELRGTGIVTDDSTAKPDTSAAEQRQRDLGKGAIPTEPDDRQDAIDAALDEGNVTRAITGMIEQQLADGTITDHGPQSTG